MKRKGMGSHTLPKNGEYDLWLTPPALLHMLGPFDLDPCACPEPRPWPTANRHICLPDDGLSANWRGRVWLNPPYGEHTGAWLEKMADYKKGLALVFARTDTEMWHRWVWPLAHSILFLAGRLNFYFPSGARSKINSGGPSALISYSKDETSVLLTSGIKGKLVILKNANE